MMDRETESPTTTLMREVFQKAKAGQFAEVLQFIKPVKVSKDFARNILICVSNACYNDSSNISKKEVHNLLNIIICSIDTVEGQELVTYLQSVFHIIKYMYDKEWFEDFEDITEMEFLIFPTFLENFSAKSTKEGITVYKAIINKLCNSIVRLGEKKTTTYKICLLRFITLILKANRQASGLKNTLLLARKFLYVITNLKVPVNQVCEFYFIIVDCFAVDLKKAEYQTDGVESLIDIFSIVISHIIKADEFHVAETFLGNVETRIRLSSMQQEFVMCHLMFKSITAMCPSNAIKMQTNMESGKEIIKDFKRCNKNILLNVIRFLEEPINDLLSYYKSSNIWCKLPSDTVFNMLRLVRDICCHLAMASVKCSCGCSLENNYHTTLKVGKQISGLLKCYLESNKKVPKRFYSEVEQWQIYFYEMLKKVKAHNCKKWSQIYRELGTYTYNIGTLLYHQENVAFVDVYRCFLLYSIEFEGCSPELLKQSLNEVTVHVICELENKNGNVEKCMTFAALYCLLYPLKCNSIFQNWWIVSKVKVKEDSTIQQQTLVSVLMNNGPTLSSIVNIQKYLNPGNKVELLRYELLRYKTVWKSKEPLMAAFSHLIEIADMTKISQIILEIFGDGDIQLHDNMHAIFSKTSKRIQEFLNTNPNHYLKMAIAVLYYYNYKYSSKDTVAKNLEEMDRTMQVMESAKENFEPIPKDPNDECDIVSAYSNLRLSKFTELIKSLNKSVELIASCTTQSYEPEVVKNISKLLTKIGFEYRLHCFSIKCLQSFELSLKFAQIISDNAAQLLAISFLIENANTKANFVNEMITKADEIANLLEKENFNDRHSKTLAIYQISKTRAFLYDDAILSYEFWKIADALVTANETKDEFKFLRADLHILHYKLTKSCSVVPGEHDRNPMTLRLHYAMDIVINLTHKNAMCPYELCIVFDTVYELAKIYYLMRLPRDLRAYSKNSVLLTQKMVVPMRCVSFLILLAHSDLLTCKMDHCNVKLNGVNDIFCLSQSRPVILGDRADVVNFDVKIIENEIDGCTSQIQEMTLDVPQHTRQYSPSSPALVVESFKAPHFLSHDKNCMCFICLSFEYHQLLLQKYHLDALFNMYGKDENMAEEFIQGALMLYKTLMRNYDCYREKAKSLISESLIFNFDDSFREYYGNILYDYSFHLMRKSQRSKALKTNMELVQLIKPKKFQYVYLYNDALLQRLSYIMPEPKGKSCQIIEIEDNLSNLRLTPKDNISLQKTPTSKKSTVTVTINGISKLSPPKRRLRKKPALFNSPIDNEDADRKPSQTQNGKTPKRKISKKSETESPFALPKTKAKKNSIPILGTPLLSEPQTPKIPIFMDEDPIASVRKSRRKQPSSVKNQRSMDTLLTNESLELSNGTKKSCRNIGKTINWVLDENINGSKENDEEYDNCQHQPPVISRHSKTRSQLLTQKIKASSQQSKTCSTTLRKRLVGGLLVDKIAAPINGENISPNTDKSDPSSVILESPEHEIATSKSKAILDKGRLSVKKKNEIENSAKAESGAKKNLFSDFLDNEAAGSGSRCTKHTGAIRKSTRNRVL